MLFFQKNGFQFRDIKGGRGLSSDAGFRIPKKFGGNHFLESQKVETIF